MPLRLAAALVFTMACVEARGLEPPKIVGVQLGLGGQYKLGSWAPLRVRVAGGSEPLPVTVVAIAPDADGVGVATTPPGDRPISAEPGRESEAVLYTRVGKSDAPIELRLMVGRKVADRLVVDVGDPSRTDRIEIGVAATATQRLVAELGGDGGVEAFQQDYTKANRESNVHGQYAPGAARVTDLAELPRDALGYDGFDAVVLVAGSSGWLNGAGSSDPRIRALETWVRGGGRLVFSCGAAGADLLAGDGPLAPFVPGRFDRLAALPRPGAIEGYSEAVVDDTIELEGGDLQVSRIDDARGVIEAYDGRDPATLPLVIRSPLGFGEVTFVAFDLDHPAVIGWEGRGALLARLLGPRFEPRENDNNNYGFAYYYDGDDYVSAISRNLDGAFQGVGNTPFMAVVALVLGYLLLIGPGDYFLVKRVIGRMEATWITFPLIVVLTSVGAYLAARWVKGDDLLVNQIEILDVDTTEGRVRGTLLTHLFSPVADRYDLALEARGINGDRVEADERSTAWLGKPGGGIGGMSQATPTRIGWRPDYAIDPTPLLSPTAGATAGTVFGLPIQVWSTKTLLSVWSANSSDLVEAELLRGQDGLAEGRVTNRCGAALQDCRLLYGDWALKLGDLDDGETAEVVTTGSSVLRVSTLLATSAGAGKQRGDLSIDALAQRLTLEGSAETDSHREATSLAHCDLAHHLAAGRALLLAKLEGPRSALLRDGGPLVDDDSMRSSWVYARFVLEVDDRR